MFPKRVMVTPAKDVQQLVAAAFACAPFESLAHMVNSTMRYALIKFAPPELNIRLDRFEKRAFAKELKAATKKKVVCPKRFTVTLEKDVRQLGGVSMQRTAWVSFQHLVEACMRHSLTTFATPAIEVEDDPFEHFGLLKPRIKRNKP